MNIYEDGPDVVIRYPGFRLAGEPVPDKRHRCCPYCDWGPAPRDNRYACSDMSYFFRCGHCIDPTTGQPSTWKEPRLSSES